MSDRYGKILKKYGENNQKVTSLHFFENDDGFGPSSSYFKRMIQLSNEGYTQVILNSELMIQLSINLKLNDYKILDIEFDDYVDENDELRDLFVSIINEASQIYSKNELSNWFLQRDSILISKVSVVNKVERKKLEINRSGLVFGDEMCLKNMFDNVLSVIIDKYLGE